MASAAVCFQQKIKKMGNSLTMISILMLAPFFLGISPVDAQNIIGQIATLYQALAPVYCNANSPDCCWAIRSWQRMGKRTLANHKKPTACCSYVTSDGGTYTFQENGIPGVTCTTNSLNEGNVTGISWTDHSLKGRIPSGIGYLKNLEQL